MQQQTAPPPAPKASSFAGLLAALAAPESKRVPAWNVTILKMTSPRSVMNGP